MRRKLGGFGIVVGLTLAMGCSNGGGDGGSGSDGGPLSKPIKDCMPTPLASTGDIHEDCFNRINQFRVECQRLPPYTRWTAGESCADDMAEYDSVPGRNAHAGWIADICDGGWAQNECPGWPSNTSVINGCLQDMWDEGPGTGAGHGHYNSMSSQTYTQVACGFFTDANGDVWAVQNFK